VKIVEIMFFWYLFKRSTAPLIGRILQLRRRSYYTTLLELEIIEEGSLQDGRSAVHPQAG
jgi:hypothetical protein